MSNNNPNDKFISLTRNKGKSVDLNVCNPNYVVDLTDINSTLPIFVHSIKYKGKIYRIKVNGVPSDVKINRFWLAGFIFGDGHFGSRGYYPIFKLALNISNLHVLILIQEFLGGVGNISFSKNKLGYSFAYVIQGFDCIKVINAVNGVILTPKLIKDFKKFIDLYNLRYGPNSNFRFKARRLDNELSFIPSMYSLEFLLFRTEYMLGLLESDGSFFITGRSLVVTFRQKRLDMCYFIQCVFGGRVNNMKWICQSVYSGRHRLFKLFTYLENNSSNFKTIKYDKFVRCVITWPAL